MISQAIAARGLSTPWDALITAQAEGDVSVASLIKGIIARESEWNPAAVNPSDPSYGLMQILAGPRGPYPSIAVADLLNPSTNIVLGSRFLVGLLARYNVRDAVSSYNAGRPIAGNQGYVDDVLTYQVYYLNRLTAAVNTTPETEPPGTWTAAPDDAASTDTEPSPGPDPATLAGMLLLGLAAYAAFAE